MRPLTASEAISPAIDRTKTLLLQPFHIPTFFKIAAVAFFAEMGGGFGLSGPGRMGNIPAHTPVLKATWIAFFLAFGLVVFILGLILLYVGSRLQLVLVEMVATRYPFVAPLWRKAGRPTWRWIGLKLLLLLPTILLVLLLLTPFLLRLMQRRSPLDPAHSPALVSHIVLLLAIVLPLVFLLIVAGLALRDFATPLIALEGLTISQSLRRIKALVAAEPGQVALYLLLRVLLGFALAIAGEIAVAVTLLISLIPIGILGGVLWFALRNAGAAGSAVLIGCAIAAALLLSAWILCVAIGVLGAVFVFLQAYAIYFLAGRYPYLGDLVDPQPMDHPTPPPPLAQYLPQWPAAPEPI